MLGGDMSGGQAGTHAALTLSNAITNLSVGCWSGVAELAPLPPANVSKWRQQVRWYTAPLEQIIVKEDGVKTLEDGTEVEVVHDVVREDVRVELPILIKCDDEQQALYARFLDVEWHYVKPTAKEAADEAAAPGGGGGGGGGQWWKKVAAMKAAHPQLSERWVSELRHVVLWASAALDACRTVNDACLARMATPEEVLEALPKHAKGLGLGDHIHKALERGLAHPKTELSTADAVYGVLSRDGVDRAGRVGRGAHTPRHLNLLSVPPTLPLLCLLSGVAHR